MKAKEIEVVIYEPNLKEKKFFNSKVIRDLEVLNINQMSYLLIVIMMKYQMYLTR